MKFLLVFFVLSLVNVVFSTIRSITTIKSGKAVASLVSGGYFAFYNVMLIFTVADFPMWQKCVITFATNVIGVWIVKVFEDKMRKDKIWRVEFSTSNSIPICEILNTSEIPYTVITTAKGVSKFEVYCYTQKESVIVKKLVEDFNVKYFINEGVSF